MQFGGGRWDGSNWGGNLHLWKGGSWDVLSCNMFSRIVSKVLVDKGVLGGCGKEVFFFVFAIGRLVGRDMGKDVKAIVWGGRDRGTGNNVLGAIRDVEEREVFDVVKSRLDELGGLRDNGLEDMRGDVKGTWVVPSIVRALEDLKDGSSGVRDVLLVDIVKGRPGSNGDVGKGGGGNGGRLRRVERHLILN